MVAKERKEPQLSAYGTGLRGRVDFADCVKIACNHLDCIVMTRSTRNISVRMPEESIERVDRLAKALGRSRAWVLNQAAEHYLDYEEWFVREVQAGLQEAREGQLQEHDAIVEAWEAKRAAAMDPNR